MHSTYIYAIWHLINRCGLSYAGLLTKKFINLIKQAEDGILDLNKAADILEVSARHLSYILHAYVFC